MSPYPATHGLHTLGGLVLAVHMITILAVKLTGFGGPDVTGGVISSRQVPYTWFPNPTFPEARAFSTGQGDRKPSLRSLWRLEGVLPRAP